MDDAKKVMRRQPPPRRLLMTPREVNGPCAMTVRVRFQELGEVGFLGVSNPPLSIDDLDDEDDLTSSI